MNLSAVVVVYHSVTITNSNDNGQCVNDSAKIIGEAFCTLCIFFPIGSNNRDIMLKKIVYGLEKQRLLFYFSVCSA